MKNDHKVINVNITRSNCGMVLNCYTVSVVSEGAQTSQPSEVFLSLEDAILWIKSRF